MIPAATNTGLDLRIWIFSSAMTNAYARTKIATAKKPTVEVVRSSSPVTANALGLTPNSKAANKKSQRRYNRGWQEGWHNVGM